MTVVCACSICDLDIQEGTQMADQKVYKLGELSYISLAHYGCAVEANRAAVAEGRQKQWEHD